MGWLRRKLGLGVGVKRFNKANVAKLTNDGGIYEFYDEYGRKIYVGRTSGGRNSNGQRAYGLKHRVSSYHQKDDFGKVDGHPTKKALRPEIAFFDTTIINNKKERRSIEKRLRKRHGYKHNHI